jgi:acyl carrier protein
MTTLTDILDILKEVIAEEIASTPDQVDEHATFHALGLDSISAIVVLDSVERKLGLAINPISFWDYPTPHLLADYLLSQQAADNGDGDKKAL